MLILLVGLTFLIFSFSSYGLAYQINGINRAVICTPITIFESSVKHDLTITNPEVQFSKELVSKKLEHYYSKELSKFTDDFLFEIYFYNIDDDSMCVKDKCEAVEITFDAFLLYQYHYHRVLRYEILKSNYGS